MSNIDTELAEVERMSGDVMDLPEGKEPQAEEQPTQEPKDEPRHEQHEQVTEEKPEVKEEEAPTTPEPSQKKEEETPEAKAPETPTKRPSRYIPVKKYTDEKRQWKETEDDLRRQLAEAQATATQEKGSETTTQEKAEVAADAVRVFAEKHGFNIDQVNDLVQVVADSAIPPEVKQLIAQQKELAADTEATQQFETQWNGVVGELRSLYPEATEAQLVDAKALLEQMAHTEETQNVPLKYLIAGERDAFDEVFGKPQLTHEGARTGTNQRSVSAKDFDDGVTSFDTLVQMSEEERRGIVRDMKPSTYDKYMRYVMASDDDVEIRRDGRLV